jgi:three-Cys-motif partner protein
MRVDPLKFFQRPQLQSRRKHRLLSRYLPPWAAKLSQRSQVLYCIDGFAGAGKYSETDEAGSPLMMARLIDQAASWKNSPTLRVIAVEPNRRLFASLERLVRPWVEQGSMILHQAPFDGPLVQRILEEIGGAPAYFFLDPFDQTDLPRPVLDLVLSRREPTDVTVNFNGPALYRMAARLCEPQRAESAGSQLDLFPGEATRPQRSGLTIAQAAAATVGKVDTVIGSTSWRTDFCDRLPSARIDRLRECYTEGADRRHYWKAWYPVRASLRQRARYDLIHFARHPDAFILLNDSICKEEDRLWQEFHEEQATARGEPLMLEFSPEARRRERMEHLRERVVQLLATGPASQDQLLPRLIFEGGFFGSFETRDLTEARGDLFNLGRITQANPRDSTKNAATVWRLRAPWPPSMVGRSRS